MMCNIHFDYISPTGGEYWYRCLTCGAQEWFVEPLNDTSPLQNCKDDGFNSYVNELVRKPTELMTRAELLGLVVQLQDYIDDLENRLEL